MYLVCFYSLLHLSFFAAIPQQASFFQLFHLLFGHFHTYHVSVSSESDKDQPSPMIVEHHESRIINAKEAEQQGLINRCVPSDQLDQVVDQWCQSIRNKPAVAIRMGKQLFYQQLEMGLAAAYQTAGETMACNMMDEAAQEGFAAFLEKRRPHWRLPE